LTSDGSSRIKAMVVAGSEAMEAEGSKANVIIVM